MGSHIFWYVMSFSLVKSINVSENKTASIFRVEEQLQQPLELYVVLEL
jgi:hypothetical protein